jgi:LEA14-like dessication related protein
MVLLLVISGCSSLVQRPEVELKRTTLLRVDTSGADLEFYLGVSNPNAFDVSLLGYTYELKIMTLPLAAGGLREDMLFAAGRETDMRLPIRLKYADLVEVLKRRPDPDGIPYQLKADLQIKTFMGEMIVPLDSSGKFSLPEKYRPAYYLDRLRERLRPLSP